MTPTTALWNEPSPGRLQPKLAQRRVVVGAPAERPVILALALLDGEVVDAGDAPPHQAVLVELPVLVTVAAKPVAAVVVPFVGEAHRDAVVAERPDLLDQAVVELAVPLARQERFDGGAALQKLRAIAPAAVGRIRERDARGIARVPRVLGHARLLRGGLGGEGRKRRAAHRSTSGSMRARRAGHFFSSASRCLISVSSSCVCCAIRSVFRSSSSAPENAAACSMSCRMLSRAMAMRCSSSEREGELLLLIMSFPGQVPKA